MTVQALGAPGREQLLVRLDGAAQLRDIVAEHFAEAARLEKIALHVDDAAARSAPGRTRTDTAPPATVSGLGPVVMTSP